MHVMLIKRMHNKNCMNLSRGQFWQILIIFLSYTFAVTKQHYFICPVHAYLHLPYQWFSWRPPWRRWFHFHDQPSPRSRAGPPVAPANQHVGETAHISSGKMCAWYGKGSSHKLHNIVTLDMHEQGHLTNVLSVVASNGAINHTLILPYHMMYMCIVNIWNPCHAVDTQQYQEHTSLRKRQRSMQLLRTYVHTGAIENSNSISFHIRKVGIH